MYCTVIATSAIIPRLFCFTEKISIEISLKIIAVFVKITFFSLNVPKYTVFKSKSFKTHEFILEHFEATWFLEPKPIEFRLHQQLVYQNVGLINSLNLMSVM